MYLLSTSVPLLLGTSVVATYM